MSPINAAHKIRISVVGAGRIAKNHFSAIQQHADHLELTAVCDTNAERLKAASEEHSAPGYRSLKDLLTSNDKPDIVTLCTPSGLHPEQAILAAEHGVHVMTEKLLAPPVRVL